MLCPSPAVFVRCAGAAPVRASLAVYESSTSCVPPLARWSCLRSMQRARPTTLPGRSSRRSVVPSKTKPLTKAQLVAYEAKRDLAAELLQSVREMKAGRTRVVSSPVIEARQKTGLSQSQFAALLGVSVRTLQGWEQGRKQPSGAARTLLAIASSNPKALLAVAG